MLPSNCTLASVVGMEEQGTMDEVFGLFEGKLTVTWDFGDQINVYGVIWVAIGYRSLFVGLY